MKKISHQNISKFFLFTRQTWAKWKEEGRPVTKMVERYFSNHEIEEFLTTNKIKKLELIKDLSIEELEAKLSLNSQNKNNIILLNNKLINFPLKGIVALYFLLKKSNFIDSKDSFLAILEQEFNSIFKIKLNLSLDFSTKWDKNILMHYIKYLLDNDDIITLFQNKDYYLSYINFIKKSKRWSF